MPSLAKRHIHVACIPKGTHLRSHFALKQRQLTGSFRQVEGKVAKPQRQFCPHRGECCVVSSPSVCGGDYCCRSMVTEGPDQRWQEILCQQMRYAPSWVLNTQTGNVHTQITCP